MDSARPVSAEARDGVLRRVPGAHGREGDCWQRCGGGGGNAGVAGWYASTRPGYAGPVLGDVASGDASSARGESGARELLIVRTLNPTGRFVDLIA
ncbi:MAG: hypothetical protein ACYTF7_05040 [Planctomycetota bacterium]